MIIIYKQLELQVTIFDTKNSQYYFKYSSQIQIICTELYGFKFLI